MKMKKVLAVVMSLCMVTGVVSYGAPALTHTVTAQASAAADACFSYDENSGVLFLRGKLDGDKIRDFCYKQYIKYIIATESTVFPEDCSELFSGYKNCITIDISEADTSNVTNMRSMFYQCSALTELDVSGFDTSKIKGHGLDYAFGDCKNLRTITLGEKFKNITADVALPNGEGWVNANAPTTVISGDGDFAVIDNDGKNTYKQYIENKPNYPAHVTNIKVEYSEKYHQVRFAWNKVGGTDRYGIAVYLAGKWRVQAQNITDNFYTTPKNLVPGKTYKVAIAARVNGSWDTKYAIRNAITVTVK